MDISTLGRNKNMKKKPPPQFSGHANRQINCERMRQKIYPLFRSLKKRQPSHLLGDKHSPGASLASQVPFCLYLPVVGEKKTVRSNPQFENSASRLLVNPFVHAQASIVNKRETRGKNNKKGSYTETRMESSNTQSSTLAVAAEGKYAH